MAAIVVAPGLVLASGSGVASAATCISSGSETAINAALVGSGAQAVLCPNAVFTLNNSITFTAPNQQVYTQGLPTDSTRAVLRLGSGSVTTAINGNGQSGIVIENIQVDGNIAATGKLDGGALIEIGGAGSNQTVQDINAHDTRSWSTLHIIEGAVTNSIPQCQSAKIVDNTIGPAGYPSPGGAWADGISLACGNSLVQGNTVVDATDGGIVVFGAPGSTIQNNTVIAKTRQLLGGINMVDYAPMNGNYTGTKVQNNVIDAQSAFIKVGLAMGPQAWSCTTGTNYGATVTGNTLQGGDMGYGYAVNGVSSWTVTGNVDNAQHVGTPGSGCGGLPSAPAGFQYQMATSSTLQSQFQPGSLEYLLGITAPTGTPTSNVNLALNRPTAASGSNGGFPPSNAVDGNSSSYWESTNNAFPQWLQVDLGQSSTIGKVVIKLPPSTAWGARTQTLSVLGSSDGNSFSTIVGSTNYAFDPTTNANTATITFNAATARFVRLNFTANTGWPAGQASEFEVYSTSGGGGGGSATLSSSPSSLSFANRNVGTTSSQQQATVHNSGSVAAVVSSINTSGDFAQTNNCGTSIAAGASCTINVTFTPTATGTRTGSVAVNSNASNSPTNIALTGTGTSTTSNLALGKAMSASSYTQTYSPNMANDNNTSSYWESANNAFPQWLQIDLGSATPVGRVVITLPPSAAWATRTQTISVQGSTDGSSFVTAAGSATYTFDPATGNTVTITFATTSQRYLRLTFTANSGWPAGQASEFEVFSS